MVPFHIWISKHGFHGREQKQEVPIFRRSLIRVPGNQSIGRIFTRVPCSIPNKLRQGQPNRSKYRVAVEQRSYLPIRVVIFIPSAGFTFENVVLCFHRYARGCGHRYPPWTRRLVMELLVNSTRRPDPIQRSMNGPGPELGDALYISWSEIYK